MHKYIQHPITIPIHFQLNDAVSNNGQVPAQNIQYGLTFESDTQIDPGKEIVLQVPIRERLPEIKGTVAWCKNSGSKYKIAVNFYDAKMAFQARMIEQVCHIEDLRLQMTREEGREVSREDAASVWIKKHAREFPYIN